VTQSAKELLQWGIGQLQPVLNEGAMGDARILLAHAMGIDRGLLGARLLDAISAEQITNYKNYIDRRMKRQPVSQIIGTREFWGRNFRVTPDVLDPRPDTETLIEMTLAGGKASRILDLGTGSGCILLTLLAEWPEATGQGVDQSEKALQIAKMNAQDHGLVDRADFTKSDWFSKVTGQYDLIVSNPPYITEKAMQTVAPEVRDWEPRMALTPEGDGLDTYRIIAEQAKPFLTPNGRVFLEIGYDQAEAVLDIFAQSGLKDGICHQDLAGKDRVVSFEPDKTV
jgi:release factor glutamine methyltransferase